MRHLIGRKKTKAKGNLFEFTYRLTPPGVISVLRPVRAFYQSPLYIKTTGGHRDNHINRYLAINDG